MELSHGGQPQPNGGAKENTVGRNRISTLHALTERSRFTDTGRRGVHAIAIAGLRRSEAAASPDIYMTTFANVLISLRAAQFVLLATRIQSRSGCWQGRACKSVVIVVLCMLLY